MAGFEEARARKALQGAGLDLSLPIERASSVTNEVWLAGEYVIRVNRHPNQRLRREAALAPLLPADIGYPEIVAYGGDLGADWLVCRRVPGLVLSRCWPAMTPLERREAVRQLATKLRRIHRFEVPPDLPPIETPQLLGGAESFSPVDPLLDALNRVRTFEHVDARLIDQVGALVRKTAFSLDPFETSTLVHGDLTFENVLWDGSQITAILDFEWARGGPADLDLDVFLRFCAYPFLHVAEDYEHLTVARDYVDVPWWLGEDYPELFDFRQQFERIRLYAIAYDVNELLRYPPPDRPANLSPYHPYNRLERTVHGTSHLDDLREGQTHLSV
jgi:aminoglycoside phosphotransferase